MLPSSQFEIIRHRPTNSFSGKFVSAYLAANSGTGAVDGTETAKRGIALGAHLTDGESVDLAQGNSFLGHLTRRVVVGGAQLADRVFGVVSPTPVGLEYPFPDGTEVTVEEAETVEAEGADYLLLSGTGLLNTSTSVGTKCSFKDGKFYVAQGSDTPYYNVSANNLDSTDGVSLRMRFERI